MKFRNSEFIKIMNDEFINAYSEEVLNTLRKISEDKTLSNFDSFNKRMQLNSGMEIDYNHGMSSVTRAQTQDVYRYMLKISDLWFAFEYICVQANIRGNVKMFEKCRSKCDIYPQTTIASLQINKPVKAFNVHLQEAFSVNKMFKVELYRILAYLGNNTNNFLKQEMKNFKSLLKGNTEFDLEFKNINYLLYALRNIYVHKGVSASLGTKSMKFKNMLYSMLYEYLLVVCHQIGYRFCLVENNQVKKS